MHPSPSLSAALVVLFVPLATAATPPAPGTVPPPVAAEPASCPETGAIPCATLTRTIPVAPDRLRSGPETRTPVALPRAKGEGEDDSFLDFFLDPGEAVVFHVTPETGATEAELPPEPDLTDTAEEAVSRAPAWVRNHLRLTLSYLEEDLQDTYGALITELEDPDLVDEVAFSVAALAPEDLAHEYFLPELLVENAAGIYDTSGSIPFAELVEEGEAGTDDDWTTTVAFTYEDPEEGLTTWTVPYRDYYWYVVHPKQDLELPLLLDPDQYALSEPPAGVFWRPWFMESGDGVETFDYRLHYLEEAPYAVDAGEPDELGACGTLVDVEVDPLRVVVDEEGGLVLAEQDLGSGTVLSTTLRLADADPLESDLLHNLALYVQRRDTLTTGETTLVLVEDPLAPPAVATSFTAALDDYGVPWEMTSPDELAALEDPASQYEKIIVPGTFSQDYHDALMELEETLEGFAEGGGTLLVVVDDALAEDTGEEALAFPGGFSVEFGTPEGLTFEGHPLLADSLADFDVVWDYEVQEGLSGSRALEEATCAADAIGWWVSQNMFDNVSEYSETHSSYERAAWAQRILHNHYGNCGELQDVINAAFRSALLPCVNVQSMEDHVWNQFLFPDGWHPFQVSWSDGPTYIDDPGVAADATYGGGKEVSSIKTWLGNGKLLDEHVALYTDTITVDVKLVDGAGLPVDGAAVVALSESYYADAYLDQAAWDHTDGQGEATLHLGDNRNYWIMVRTAFDGEYESSPFDFDESTMATDYPYVLATEVDDPQLTVDETTASSEFTFEHTFEGAYNRPVAGGTMALEEGLWAVGLALDLVVEETLQDIPGHDTYAGWMAELGWAYGGRLIHPLEEPLGVDVYVVDDAGWEAFQAGETFEPLWSSTGITDLEEDLELFADGDLHVLVVNPHGRHVHFGEAAVTATSEAAGGCGCAAPNRSRRGGAVAVLALLTLLGIAGRRRVGAP